MKTLCPECGSPAPCAKCRETCPGDQTHYFRKGERACKCCHRWLTDHAILEDEK